MNLLYNQCGGKTPRYPQMTIYDSLAADGVDFGIFMNSTCGLPNKHGSITPCNTSALNDPDDGVDPDLIMMGVGRHKKRFLSQELFYERAASGTLPEFSWVMPPVEACDHPCHDVGKGERVLKDVYEALRAGPGWEKTLFLVAYDDAGGL